MIPVTARVSTLTGTIPLPGVGLPTVHYLLHFLGSWRGLLAWASLGLVAFVAVALAIRAEAKSLRVWTRKRRTVTSPSGNVSQ